MKHIMNASSRWQGEADGGIVDQLGDAVRPEVAGLELAGDFLGPRRGCTLVEPKERPVPHLVRNVAVDLVIVQLLSRLGLFQPVAGISQELVALLHAFGDRCHPSISRFIGPDGLRITPVDDAEGRVLQGGLVGGVEDVFRPWQPPERSKWLEGG